MSKLHFIPRVIVAVEILIIPWKEKQQQSKCIAVQVDSHQNASVSINTCREMKREQLQMSEVGNELPNLCQLQGRSRGESLTLGAPAQERVRTTGQPALPRNGSCVEIPSAPPKGCCQNNEFFSSGRALRAISR